MWYRPKARRRSLQGDIDALEIRKPIERELRERIEVGNDRERLPRPFGALRQVAHHRIVVGLTYLNETVNILRSAKARGAHMRAFAIHDVRRGILYVRLGGSVQKVSERDIGGKHSPNCFARRGGFTAGEKRRMSVSLQDEVLSRVVELRREIHRHPELGFEETRTQSLIERELDALGVEHRRCAKTGVVAVVRGAKPGHVVGLRADMDALPVSERSGEPFSSEVEGKMHACGHDAHTAMLLGAAHVLQGMRSDLHGTAVLLFQPAEEGAGLPAIGGAEPMIAEGALDDPNVEAIAMLHVDTRLETGQIGITPGPVSASADEMHIVVRGRGGHGAYPHTATDTIPATAAMILALQNIAARETDPLKSVVVTIGTITGGYRSNIIADEVKMTGTLRAHDPEIRDGLETRLRRILGGVADAYGVSVEVNVHYGYPPVVNNVALAENFALYMKTHSQLQVERPAPTMGAEDFAYYAQRVPGLLVRLGIRNEKAGSTHSGHSALFRIDEKALPVGVQTLVAFATAVGAGAVAAS